MDLIDRYLVAVRRQLPRTLQDDIVQELADNLRSEAEEHEQAPAIRSPPTNRRRC